MRNRTFFQIANRSDAEVKAQFIVRKNEFEIVMSDIKRDDMKGSIQHYIFVGQRGSGKSTLLRRIEAEIKTEPTLADHLVAVNLSEEQAGIYRLHDLWFKVNEALEQKGYEVEKVNWQQYEKDLTAYARHLYQAMQTALNKKGKKLVLLLDNIDRILSHIKGDDNHLFRELLMNHKDVRIVGGSTRLSEHYWSYEQPFYQFFRIIRLAPITQQELTELLTFWSDFFGEPKLIDFIKKYPGKLNAVRILSDGMPRTMLNLVELLINKPDEHGYNYLLEIIDKATPIYQDRLAALSDLQQKILLELSFYWDAADLKHLSESARMDSKLLSAVLKQLVEMKLVDKKKDKGKNYYYLLTERFFNLWLIMTQGGPKEKSKVKWLTAFLETWYDSDELKHAFRQFAKDLSTGCLNADQAVLRAKAFAHSKILTTKERDKLIESMEKLSVDKQGYMDMLPAKSKDIYRNAMDLIKQQNYDKAIAILEDLEQEDASKDFLMAFAYQNKGEKDKTEYYYLKSAKGGAVEAMNNLAGIYHRANRLEEAKKYYMLAIEGGEKFMAPFNLALLYKGQNDLIQAEKYYLMAANNKHVGATNNLGNLYREQGKTEEAENYLLEASKMGAIEALNNLGSLYASIGKFETAEQYFLLAIGRGNTDALNNLANIYWRQNRIEDAEKVYLQAISHGNQNAIYNLSLFYEDLGRIEDAEKYLLISAEKGNTDALNFLAHLYSKQGRFDEAEKVLLTAIAKGDIIALNNLGALYFEDKGDIEKAEKYFLLAIDKGLVESMFNLGNVYKQAERWHDSEKYYLDAIRNGHQAALFNFATLIYLENGKAESALEYLSKFKNNGNVMGLRDLLFEKIISIWSGHPEVLDNAFDLIQQGIEKREVGGLELFLTDVLIHHQKNTVWQWFENKEFGDKLKDMLKPLYFATARLLNNSAGSEVLLTQPPELNETVEQVYQYILERQKFYYGEAEVSG